MRFSNEILKTVAFLGVRESGVFSPRATCFFVSYYQDGLQFDHLVTAEHVISGLITRHEIWLRVNLKNGEIAEIQLDHSAFRFHPNDLVPTDVAVSPISTEVIEPSTGQHVPMDIRTLPLNGDGGYVANAEWFDRYVGLGSEISTVGLFKSHFGRKRNIPIARVGNISALPGEPIATHYCREISAYLVEARSIAGLSGSPVFAMPELSVVLSRGLNGGKMEKQGTALLGLMHGHFDVRNLNEDVVLDSGPERSIHTGIGVVVPVEKIVETIEHPDLVIMRAEIASEKRRESSAP